MELTLTLQSPAISEEALHDLTRDLCNTLNRETEMSATLPEASGEPGARGVPIQPLIEIAIQGTKVAGSFVAGSAHEVMCHSIGIVIGESLLMTLKPFLERHSSLKATVRDRSGNERVVDVESVQPGRIRQTARDLDEAMIGLS